MREADSDQLQAIECEGDAVIEAGAGSGKTRVLAERYLRLIREGEATVESILMLTFTRKAAAEMYDRVYRLLGEQADDERASAALTNFDRAQISTLDALCGKIARAGAADLGVPPDFTSDEDRLERLVAREAHAYILEHAGDAAMAHLVASSGFDQVRDALGRIALRYCSPAAPLDFEAAVEEQLSACAKEAGRAVAQVDESASEIAKLEPGGSKTMTRSVELLSDWEWRVSRCVERRDWQGAAEALAELTNKRIALTGATKRPEWEDYKQLVGILREARDKALERVLFLASADWVRACARLIAGFRDRVVEAKGSAGLLSYQDVLDCAVAVLERDDALRLWYCGRVSHIMIDEFQDNNARQKQLLYLLAGRDAEGRAVDKESPALMFVGDEKQSIYRFRGADVSVFKALGRELSEVGGTVLRLGYNYRSAPPLVELFNLLFPHIFGDAEREFEARFAPLATGGISAGSGPAEVTTAAPCDAHAGGVDGTDVDSGASAVRSAAIPCARIYAILKEPNEGGERISNAPKSTGGGERAEIREAEAYEMCRFIQWAVEGGLRLPADSSQGPARPVTYDDIAVLMYRTTRQGEYEEMMRRFGIPYTADSVRSLYLDAPANDIYSVLQVCVHPDDRHAYAAFLRSPFVGVSDDGLIRILASRARPGEELDSELGLSQADSEVYRRACGLLHRVSQRLDDVPLDEVIRHLWYREGYRYLLLYHPANHTFLEHYDYLCELAREHEADGVAAFLDSFREHLGSFERITDSAVEREEPRGVRLTTIFRAKGLEFPVVLLANAEAEPIRPGGSIFFDAGEFGVTFPVEVGDRYRGVLSRRWANPYFSAADEQDRLETEAELKRLLYVALTRAEHHFAVFGGDTAGGTAGDKSMMALLNRAREGDPEVARRLPREELAPVERKKIAAHRRSGRARTIEEAEAAYAAAERISYEPAPPRISATAINAAWREILDGAPEADEHGERAPVPLPDLAIDELLDRTELWPVFGSLCHLIVAEEIEAGARGMASGPGSTAELKDGGGPRGPGGDKAPSPDERSARSSGEGGARGRDEGDVEPARSGSGPPRAERPGGGSMPRSLARMVPDAETEAALMAAARELTQGMAARLTAPSSDGGRAGNETVAGEGPGPRGGAAEAAPSGEGAAETAARGEGGAGGAFGGAAARGEDSAGDEGGAIGGAAAVESEVPFLLRFAEEMPVVSGTIDLVIHRGGGPELVDFKTDRVRRPEAYRAQLDLYRRAARELWGEPVRCVVCYLRDGSVFELESLPEERYGELAGRAAEITTGFEEPSGAGD